VVNRVSQPLRTLKIPHPLLIFALVICFGFAVLASLIGIAGLVGAFLAGVALSESTDGTKLHSQSGALTEFTAPFFLVNIGMKLNLSIFMSAETLALAAVVIVLAIATKLVGCGIGASRMGRRRAFQVGAGMIPRGEVGIVVAQIGLGLAAVSDAIYGVVLAMAVITMLAAPPLIRLAFAGEATSPGPAEYDDELQERIG